MYKYIFTLLASLSSLWAVGQSITSGEKKQSVLFSVAKAPTYTDEFMYLYRKNNQKDFSEAKIGEYLNLLINFKLKVAEARHRGMDTTLKFQKEFKTYREELKKPYRADGDLLDLLTKQTYQRLTQEVKASHILVSLKPDAFPTDTLAAYTKISSIKNRVEAGEDFEKLARELSEDPSAKYNGGSLGYFTAMQMVYPFEEAAFNTAVGSLSSIVRTRFGYHLIKVIDKKQARGEVEVAHILVRTGTSNDAKVKNTIFEIYDQLKAGRPWDELCKEYSEDENTKGAGGKLPPFGVGAFPSVPEFEVAAFALAKPGDISDPFQSAIGWHIVRLEKKIPLGPYMEIEAQLKRRVARDERLQISQKTLAAKRNKELMLVEDEAIKKKVFAWADSNLAKGKWKWAGGSQLKAEQLLSIQNKPVEVGQFIKYVSANQSSSQLQPTSYMAQLYDAFVEQVVSEAEEEKLGHENPEFKSLLTEYREGILLFEIMEHEVWNKASEDTTGQRKYYASHLDAYKAGDRVEARIFSTPDQSVLEALKKKIANGDSLKEGDIKKLKSVQNFRSYEKGESKVIDKITWAAGMHETQVDNNFYLVEISRLVAPGTKTFQEARASIIADYQNYLESEWIASLKKKYPVKINKKSKKSVIAELQKR